MKPIHYLVVFLVLNQSTFSGTRFLVALYAVHQQASALVVGALVALFSAAAMVGAVAMGKLVDLRGTRIPVLTGTLLLASGVGLPLLWRDFAVLYVAAFLIGGARLNPGSVAVCAFAHTIPPTDRRAQCRNY